MTSPIPNPKPFETILVDSVEDKERQYNFYEALKHMVEGKKITRIEWNSQEEYGFMKDGIVMIHTKGKDHRWIISEADAIAEDWIII
jgi:hypothetical protein